MVSYNRSSCRFSRSFWSEPGYGKTDCGIINAPYRETFDGLTWIPGEGQYTINDRIDSCWTRPGTQLPFFGTISGPTPFSIFSGPVGDFNGNGKYLYTVSTSTAGSTSIETPHFYIPLNLDKPYFKFGYHMYCQFSNRTPVLRLEIDTGTGYNSVIVKNGIQQNSSSAPWKFDSLDLSSYRSDTVRFRFTGTLSHSNLVVAIDEVSITGKLKPCPVVIPKVNVSSHFLEAYFNSSGTKYADSLYWDFGDGFYSSANNPNHIYASGGNYQVKLMAFDTCHTADTLIKNITICNTLTGIMSLKVSDDSLYFSADSSLHATNFQWNLDDGHSSTQKSSFIKYSYGGWKTISLKVSNSCGDQEIISKQIFICLPAIAKWSFNYSNDSSGTVTVNFDASASKNAINYLWDFGDGNIATGKQVIHVYSKSGAPYQAMLTVNDDCGTQDSLKKFLTLLDNAPSVKLDHSIAIYPNPASDQIILEWNSKAVNLSFIELLAPNGQKIKHYDLTEAGKTLITLDLKNIPPGLYWLRISNNHTAMYRSIVIRGY